MAVSHGYQLHYGESLYYPCPFQVGHAIHACPPWGPRWRCHTCLLLLAASRRMGLRASSRARLCYPPSARAPLCLGLRQPCVHLYSRPWAIGSSKQEMWMWTHPALARPSPRPDQCTLSHAVQRSPEGVLRPCPPPSTTPHTTRCDDMVGPLRGCDDVGRLWGDIVKGCGLLGLLERGTPRRLRDLDTAFS